MQKFLIGCLGVFVVLLLLGGGAGYWFIFRPAQGAIQNVQKLEQIETFNAQVSNERSFSAPADGVIAEEQLVRYIAVQDTMMTKLQSNIDRVNEKYKDFEDEDFSLADIRKLIGGYADIINLVLEAKQVQVTALNEQGFSLEEYAWVKREALRAAALPYTELDFSEFSGGREINLPALTDEIPEANIKLLEPHKDNLEDILGLAFFGL